MSVGPLAQMTWADPSTNVTNTVFPNDRLEATLRVTFTDTTLLGTGTLSLVDGQMQATFTTAALGYGAHTIVAIYSGDSTYADSGASMQEEID